MIVLALILLLSWVLMLFPKASEKVAETIGAPVDTFKFWVSTVAIIATGLFLVWSGIAALAIPVLGVMLIIAGVAAIAFGAYPIFKSNAQSPNRG